MPLMNRQVLLATRPWGAPREENFSLSTSPIRAIKEGELLIRNLYLSLDAGFRNWMNEDSGDNVLPAMQLGQPVMGLTLGRVQQSRHPDYIEGDLLLARLAWQEYSISDATDFLNKLPADLPCPLSYYVGILGDTGLSAYFGMHDIGKPSVGETVLISAAGGAVGSVAGQLSRIAGARTVGISSSETKCQRLIDELGYDAAVNRLAGNDLSAAIAAACPDGINVYFDSVGGEVLEAALDNLASGARIVMCGSITNYTATEQLMGPANLFQLVTKEATMQGFMCHFREARYQEGRTALTNWIHNGQLKCVEYKLQGIENTAKAFCDMFAGKNFGKTIVSLTEE